jgi:hypothetical protein
MLSLILLLALITLTIFAGTYLSRRGKNEEVEVVISENSACCGAHEICEIDNLQIIDTKIEYFDDEELDVLAGISPEKYTKNQINTVSEIFYSMRENDIAPWLRSLQLRNIQLPETIKDAALLVITERREVLA